ncbi:hypothetical protein B0H14DRAFT_2849950 [Mycena olivaceomarginata]|nr:hypothetical protein B0H14DRAFT_2849950 [Mycena olivaceomarginata]
MSLSFPPIYGGTFSVSPSLATRPSTAGAVRELTEHVLPTFLEGDKITGSVTLDLGSSEKILGVSVLIRGQIVTGPSHQDRRSFLDLSTPLWLKGMPNPRDTNPGAAGSGKLFGDCHWPFSISLPKEVILPDPAGKHGAVRAYKCPQTFQERTTRASVFYELSVHIARSTFRVDNNLQTMFVYPTARVSANGPIPGPDLDPEGWHTLRTASVAGTVFNARRVKYSLSYTRGSVIPLSLTYLCNDSQALKTRLHTRHNQCAPTAAEYYARNWSGDVPLDPVLEIYRAVWWPVDDGLGSGSSRFDGEIHLPKSLKPSSNIPNFSIDYAVVMLPFHVTGFAAQSPPPLILEQNVQIATMFPKGPKPRVYSPPSYQYEIGDNMFIPPARGYI